MKHTINKITLQGRAGPSTLRLSPDGQLLASTDVQINDDPEASVIAVGIGGNALFIADGVTGDYLHIEGELAFNAQQKCFYVLVHTATRMAERDGALVLLRPSMIAVDRFETLFSETDPQGKRPTTHLTASELESSNT